MGNSHAQALEAGLTERDQETAHDLFAKPTLCRIMRPVPRCKNTTETPDEA
jgi:hypothetical protein